MDAIQKAEGGALAVGGMGEALTMARQLATSGLIPRALQGKPGDVLVVLLTGKELGLGPMQSLRGIHVVDGKAVMSADLIVALCVRERSVCEWFRVVESTDKQATYEAKRVGHPEATRLSFTIAQAQAAGLTGKDNWRKYAAAMLRARCASALARSLFPDLVAGVYDPDELDAPAPAPAPSPAPAAEAKPAHTSKRPRATEDAQTDGPPALPAAQPAIPATGKVEAPRDVAARVAAAVGGEVVPGPVVTHGHDKGKPIASLSDEDLQRNIRFFFATKNKSGAPEPCLEALKDEARKRRGAREEQEAQPTNLPGPLKHVALESATVEQLEESILWLATQIQSKPNAPNTEKARALKSVLRERLDRLLSPEPGASEAETH